MSRSKQFTYPLQPVLLTRQWELEGLTQELQEIITRVDSEKRKLGALQSQLAAANDAQQTSLTSTQLSVNKLLVFSRYVDDLATRQEVQEQALMQVEEQRDSCVDEVMRARRSVDAVEKHRDDLQSDFDKVRASAQFKAADEQWSTLQNRRASHDSQS